MTKNWPALKLELTAPPVTIPETVEHLLLVFSNEDKLAISAMNQEDLYNLHFTLSPAIQNGRLNQVDSQLRAACGTYHPDDVYHVIIGALWRTL
ncbi:DUF6794 domain-containing protein [Methylomonas methanica]|uniref:DUF6794 domain-containing protein n=1 Tax=Methylomonas methanica (strain DSM 25384 / MC09) TaxID=857087 RepID=G0A590_METMM|nr:hypothetical protein Metme_2010 [Methylomonas methanica MC09]